MERLLCCLFVFVLFACDHKNNAYLIEGVLPDNTYDQEYIYLVPLYNATAETVDSTLVKDGRFYFEGLADSAEIKILRTRPVLRLAVQELLVVVEPGTVNIALNTVSSAGGTPLNEALQGWKDVKMAFEQELYQLNSKKRDADEQTKTSIEKQQEAINREYSDRSFNFVKANHANVVGRFVYSIAKSSFSDEQKKEAELIFDNS